MKWSFIIRQKLTATLLLGGIMLLIVINTLLSRQNIQAIDQSFSSIYKDRLVPVVDIVYLSENLTYKQLLLQKHLLSAQPDQAPDLPETLALYNRRIDSLMANYEKTYLVQGEKTGLKTLKKHLADYARWEQAMLPKHAQTAGPEQIRQGRLLFQQVLDQLNQLVGIQSAVGQELLTASHGEASQFRLLSTLQLLIAIIIGVLIQILIQSSKVVSNIPKRPIHLN